jgi:hypothetical protein
MRSLVMSNWSNKLSVSSRSCRESLGNDTPIDRQALHRVVFCLVLPAFCAVTVAVAGGGQRPTSRAEFMRMKLEFSKHVLEGLALENYDAISKNAKALKRLSEAAEWEVPTIPNATDYVAFTSEFQRQCDELVQKAKDRNIDGATLAYLSLTMNCVKCHKYVRQTPR